MAEISDLIDRLNAMREEWEAMLLLPRPTTKGEMIEEYYRARVSTPL